MALLAAGSIAVEMARHGHARLEQRFGPGGAVAVGPPGGPHYVVSIRLERIVRYIDMTIVSVDQKTERFDDEDWAAFVELVFLREDPRENDLYDALIDMFVPSGEAERPWGVVNDPEWLTALAVLTARRLRASVQYRRDSEVGLV